VGKWVGSEQIRLKGKKNDFLDFARIKKRILA
jgi:hypothetical protein